MDQSKNHYIIAIAASTGSIQEVREFFSHALPEGASYVLIQPLSPGIKNTIADLLSTHTKLEIKEAEDATLVENNQVYLVPADKYTVIQKGRLYFRDQPGYKKPTLTINAFLSSLALERGKKAIAIILSGLGTDGNEGVRAIKRAGGFVVVRDPSNVGFAGMPVSAIATGMVDQILEPEKMPETITRYIQNGGRSWSQVLTGESPVIDPNIQLTESANTALIGKLLAKNEELFAENEELRRWNEEMSLLNIDYHLKNTMLSGINDDLNNYFNSILSGQVLVNRGISLLKFNPAAARLLNIRHSDLGKPLSNISTDLKLESVLEDIRNVIGTGDVINKEIRADNSIRHELTIMPYLNQDNKIYGAILQFTAPSPSSPHFLR